jgi:translation initiation factor 2A
LWIRDLQYTASESYAVRLAGPEVQVFNPTNWAAGGVAKLRIDGMTSAVLSPGANPSVALFIPEKSGQPGSIRIHNLQSM